MDSTLRLEAARTMGWNKKRFLISAILCPSPQEVMALQAGREFISGQEGDRPPLMTSTHRHSGQALAIHPAAQLWQWPCVTSGGGLWFR